MSLLLCPSGFAVRKHHHKRSVSPHGPLCSTTCSTRAPRSPPPFLPSLAHTPACLLTDLRHSRLPSPSRCSPDVLHSLDLPSLSLLLASSGACPPTGRPNNPTTASLLAPSEVSSSFPTCFIHLTHASTVPALAHPYLACPLSTFPTLKPHSSHTRAPMAPQLPTPAAIHRSPVLRLLSVYPSRFERRFTVCFQPSRVTGLQATSPKRSLPQYSSFC